MSQKSYWGSLAIGLPEAESRLGKNYLKAYELSLYLNKAIEKRAEKVGQIKFKLTKGDREVVSTDSEYQRLKLLYKPNSLFTAPEFWSLYQKYLDLTGEAYILIIRNGGMGEAVQPTELHLLRPDLVKPVFNDDGSVEKYEYRQGGGDSNSYSAEDIIYIFNPNPLNPLRGTSIVKAGIKSIETELQITEYHSKVIANGGKVENIISFKSPNLTQTQLTELKGQYEEQVSGAKNSAKPLFLGGEATFQRIGLNPEELSYMETKKMTLHDICLMTGVPKSVLSNVEDIQFSNVRESHRIFLQETIRPLLDKLTTKLDEVFFPDDNLTLSYDDPTPEDVEETRKTLETANAINALTTNEKRRFLERLDLDGLDPVDGGDEVLVPFSVSPLSVIDEEPEAPAEQQNSIVKKAEEFDHPLRDEYFRKKYGGMMIKRLDRREARFIRILRAYWVDQEKRLLEQVDPVNTRVYRRKNLIDDIFREELEIKIATDAFLPFLRDILIEAGEDSKLIAGSRFDFVISAEIQSWLEKKADIFTKEINNTTFKKLQKEFAQSLEAGESRQDLVRRIQRVYGGIKKNRAQTIARTEILGTTMKGTFEGYKQGGLPIKIWVSVQDLNTRHSHSLIDGEERPIDMPFSNGLMYPGDPSGSADEIINCRCSI